MFLRLLISCKSQKNRCDLTTSNSIQDGGALVVNILVFDLRVQLQHCTYQRKTLLFALNKVSTFIYKREISGLSSPLTSKYILLKMLICEINKRRNFAYCGGIWGRDQLISNENVAFGEIYGHLVKLWHRFGEM